MYNVGFISLGCSKNLVNCEQMIFLAKNAGHNIKPDIENCDVVVINTCGFIEDAKKEALENIFEVASLKKEGKVKKIIVAGCLCERYKNDIVNELFEVDGFLGVGSFEKINDAIKSVMKNEKFISFDNKDNIQIEGERAIQTPKPTAYLKIADGCNNNCSYCAIPKIRGRYKSRKMQSIIDEAKSLAKDGYKEIILIAQDTTNYGCDIYGKKMLPSLLKELDKIDGIKWIRILYLYPDKITDELLDVMASGKKIVNYVEMALQHASKNVLKRMHRPGDDKYLLDVINKIKNKIKGVTIRTTFISGFPGETDEDFEILCNFVKAARFDKMGVFTYSREENTPAYDFDDQIDESIKQRRKMILEDIQSEIAKKSLESHIEKCYDVIIEGFDRLTNLYYGRSEFLCPDIDEKIFISSEKPLIIGQFYKAKITQIIDFDLFAEII